MKTSTQHRQIRRNIGLISVGGLILSGLLMLPKASAFSRFTNVFQRPSTIRTLTSQLMSMTAIDRNQDTASLSNRELAERRLRVFQAKKQEMIDSKHAIQRRNLEVKRMISSMAENDDNLIAIKVTVCPELREELKLSGREKRGRVFVTKDGNAVKSLRSLKGELHAFFRALRKDTYTLSASYPVVGLDGTILPPEEEDHTKHWDIQTDEDVAKTFQNAQSFFDQLDESSSNLKRPSIILYVKRDPNAPPPPPPPPYLKDMPNPADSPTITMLSFYTFGNIEDPDQFADDLKKLWKPFEALGRVYVAPEGVNAQMSVPTNVLPQFIECCEHHLPVAEISHYLRNYGNGVNVDPKPLTREEFAVAGTAAAGGKPKPPFSNLHVRVRQQIVADGLDKSYDWIKAGYDMPPLEWHAKLEEAKRLREENREDEAPIILDCRNTYETDVGIFEGAEPLETDTFRDTWDAIKDKLKDKPKDAPIMMYCTGGIRCVKVGAYVEQELGYTNVQRLAGGIIAYDRALTELKQNATELAAKKDLGIVNIEDTTSMFKGTNFVFDGRLGRRITDDALGHCITCGADTALVSNCCNDNCHKRMVQCEKCRTSYHGTCSDACRNRLVRGMERTEQLNENMAPRRMSGGSNENSQNQEVFTTIDGYCEGHSSPVPGVYAEMEHNTAHLIPSGSHMVSGQSQGRLLKQLASMSREGRILELGTFTGYATACLLEGANAAGKVIDEKDGSREKGPFVMSMERDQKAFDVAVAQLKVISEHGFAGEAAAEAMCALRHVSEKDNVPRVPVVQETTVSLQCPDKIVGCELVKVSDALAVVEEMAAGRYPSGYVAPFDIVFVDADKTRLVEYAEACLSSDRVLKKGGLIVVDNVLWKGLVLEASGADSSALHEAESHGDDSSYDDMEMVEIRKNRRARKLAGKMHRFNSEIVKDDRAEVLVLPMRDGLSVIRKK